MYQSRLRVRWCGAEQLREVPQRTDFRGLLRKARCCGYNGCAAAAVMVVRSREPGLPWGRVRPSLSLERASALGHTRTRHCRNALSYVVCCMLQVCAVARACSDAHVSDLAAASVRASVAGPLRAQPCAAPSKRADAATFLRVQLSQSLQCAAQRLPLCLVRLHAAVLHALDDALHE